MKEIDEARKREAKQNLTILPSVVVYLVLFLGVIWTLMSEEVVFMGVKYYGVVKSLWFLNLIVMGVAALVVGLVGISVLIFIREVANSLRAMLRLPKLIGISAFLLVLSGGLFFLALYINEYLSADVYRLNFKIENAVGDFKIIHDYTEFILLIGSMFIGALMFVVISWAFLLPSYARNLAKEILKLAVDKPVCSEDLSRSHD
ncbi:hypothetical protein QSV34_11645 [Porticoccus sp. W117]|uniref:hypothetical protein n=1 Tax=Porticoccus sp. W117 TaxID=3054777 RepID=UPI0025992683|nr:hypothetical protein [Porticoccus sp. W117]MDM3872000.1 hypothetical protein [Porticoccus sp. W117]